MRGRYGAFPSSPYTIASDAEYREFMWGDHYGPTVIVIMYLEREVKRPLAHGTKFVGDVVELPLLPC